VVHRNVFKDADISFIIFIFFAYRPSQFTDRNIEAPNQVEP
jgi:hypothetical protein